TDPAATSDGARSRSTANAAWPRPPSLHALPPRSPARSRGGCRMRIQSIAVPLAANRLEAEQVHSRPRAGPAVGPSPPDDPNQAAITIPRGQGFGQPVARPRLGIHGHAARRATPPRQVQPSPRPHPGGPHMPPHLDRVGLDLILVEQDLGPLDVAGIE